MARTKSTARSIVPSALTAQAFAAYLSVENFPFPPPNPNPAAMTAASGANAPVIVPSTTPTVVDLTVEDGSTPETAILVEDENLSEEDNDVMITGAIAAPSSVPAPATAPGRIWTAANGQQFILTDDEDDEDMEE